MQTLDKFFVIDVLLLCLLKLSIPQALLALRKQLCTSTHQGYTLLWQLPVQGVLAAGSGVGRQMAPSQGCDYYLTAFLLEKYR